jgi:hypothetical protein
MTNLTVAEGLVDVATGLDTWWVLMASALVFFMQVPLSSTD